MLHTPLGFGRRSGFKVSMYSHETTKLAIWCVLLGIFVDRNRKAFVFREADISHSFLFGKIENERALFAPSNVIQVFNNKV